MDAREAIVAAGLRLLRSGLTVETWGNISLRENGSGRIYITPSGMAYDTLRPEDVVVLVVPGVVGSSPITHPTKRGRLRRPLCSLDGGM